MAGGFMNVSTSSWSIAPTCGGRSLPALGGHPASLAGRTRAARRATTKTRSCGASSAKCESVSASSRRSSSGSSRRRRDSALIQSAYSGGSIRSRLAASTFLL